MSVLIVAFLAVKVAEVVFAIDSWPLTTVPMFRNRIPPETIPFRMRVVGRRSGAPVTLTAADFGLTDDELTRRIRAGTDAKASAACGLLGTVYNQRHPPALRLDGLETRFIPVPRPGVPAIARDVVIPCPLQP